MKSKEAKFSRRIIIFLSLLFIVLLFGDTGFCRTAADQAREETDRPPANTVIQTLTENERLWLRDHPVITVVQDSGWPPIEFVDEQGNQVGMTADYQKLIEQRIGLKFKRVRTRDWQESYNRLKRWDIDMTTSVAVTPQRLAFWSFTKPYMTIPIVILAHADVTYIGNMRELNGKKIAVVEGYAAHDWILRDYPEIQLVKVRSVKEGIDLLQKGGAFAFIDNMMVIGYYLAKLKITNLKIAGETPYVNAQCMAVRKDWGILAGILQKALDSISETERGNIYHKWVPIRYEHGFNYSLLWRVLALFVLILLIFAFWVRKLSREIKFRKEAETALANNEAKFRLVFESANVGKSITLPDGELFANRAFGDMLGYTREELKNRRWQDLTPDDETETIQKILDSLLSGEKDSVRFKKRYLHKNGSTIWADVSVAIHRDEKGHPRFFIATIIDITEQKQAEEALRDSEEKYRHLFENANEAIYVAQDGKLIFQNPKTNLLTGYSSEELLSKPFIEFIHPDDRELVLGRHFKRIQGEENPQTYDFRIIHKDGKVRFVELNTVTINWKGKPATLNFLTDITERKQAEAILQQSEDKFKLAFQTSPDAININRLEDGRYVDINQGFTDLTGFTREEVLGKSSLEINIWHDLADREKLVKGLKEKGYYENLEARFRRKDGSLTTALMSARLLNLGEVPHIISITRDISERKRAEEEKQKLEERIQRAEKMEALGTLAGGVAHDLNNVLGIIVGYSELLLYDIAPSSPLRPSLTNILGGSKKAAAIVDDLLTLTRRGVANRKVLNLNKIIAECMNSPEFMMLSSYHPSIKIETDLEPDLLNLSGSPVHIGKSLLNLVSNASEAMPKGGTVIIKTTSRYLDRPIQGYDEVKEGDYVMLSVIDTGEGISAADLKRIFEPFYTKKVMGRSGTGLGLAVVWGTVKDHHGYINVQSQEGKGSTFTLYFPVTREAIAAEGVPPPLSDYFGKGESILVVDDIKGQRDLAGEMLQKLNYTVTGVSSGEEAIDYLKTHKADLVVLDMIMDPGMDGMETYEKILELHPKQKAIIVSGFSESDRVHAAQAMGAGAYVKKPYVLEKLGLAVKKELERTL